MYSKIQQVINYFRYYFKASNAKGHGTHSPFVYSFIREVLNDKKSYPEYKTTEELRSRLLKDNTEIEVEDLGAGSAASNSPKKAISAIASTAAKPKKYGQLLFRMVKRFKPQHIMELGSSLGITASYLAQGNPEAKVITVEGSKEIAEIAKENFKTLKLDNVEVMRGDFKYTLPMAMNKLGTVDFAFIDGNHRMEPTIQYFESLLTRINPNSILVFDDIHWSTEMEEAWNKIKSHPSVKCSIDLFFLGIIIFRKEFKEKQEFTIRF
jgi:predicted O-methyltransferase YrrM